MTPQRAQVIFYRLQDNSLTKTKSSKWLFICDGYCYCSWTECPLNLTLFPGTFCFLHWMKTQACFPQSQGTFFLTNSGAKDLLLTCCCLYVTLHLCPSRWPYCPLLCVFKNETSPRDYQVLPEFISNWNNKNIVYFFSWGTWDPIKRTYCFCDPNFYFFIQNIGLTKMLLWKVIRGLNKVCSEKMWLTFPVSRNEWNDFLNVIYTDFTSTLDCSWFSFSSIYAFS